MAILEMQKLSIYAMKEHRKEILEFLQRTGAMELIRENVEDGFEVMAEKSAEEIQALREKRKASDEKRRASRQKKEQQSEQAEQTVEVDADAFGSDEGIDSYSHSAEREETPTW